MKLIFLDIDGVLNHELIYREKSQDERYKEVGHPKCDLDPKKVELLNDLIYNTDAKVVIISTWRKGRNIGVLQGLLEWAGFKGEIIGITEVLTLPHAIVPRGVEIYNYLEECQSTDIQYIILDDDRDMLLRQKNNFFHVDSYCGLTPNIVRRAIKFLERGGWVNDW